VHAIPMKTQHGLAAITKFVIVQRNQRIFKVVRCQNEACYLISISAIAQI